jgi:maltose alpha-D-glucosyltransferase/alpha-amylase
VDSAKDAPTVDEQLADKNSLLHFTRKLIALRKKHPALGNDAAFRPLYAVSGKYPFVYERSDSASRFAVAVNPGERAASVTLPELKGAKLISSEGAKLVGTKLALDGVSFAILKLR